MTRVLWRSGLAAGAALTLAGCSLSAFFDPMKAGHLPVSEHIAGTAVVAIAGNGVSGRSVSDVLAAAAQPSQYVDVVRAGRRPVVLAATRTSGPVTRSIAARPKPLHPGASSYQRNLYERDMATWRKARAQARRAVRADSARRARGQVRALRVPARPGLAPGSAAGDLGAECNAAARVIARLTSAAGQPFTGPRVAILYPVSLSGRLSSEELTGDAVIVVMPYLPAEKAVASAQLKLVEAGAIRVTVVGPEDTAGEVASLVSGGLRITTATQVLAGRLLFASGSAVPPPAAVPVLRRLLRLMLRPGATAIINGYASTPGTRRHNYLLSVGRARAVCQFLVKRRVPRLSIVVVGHGAIGPSARDQRVTVVVAES
jgi:outer membrane protein OmpA-like peptidoglycan-associated protein